MVGQWAGGTGPSLCIAISGAAGSLLAGSPSAGISRGEVSVSRSTSTTVRRGRPPKSPSTPPAPAAPPPAPARVLVTDSGPITVQSALAAGRQALERADLDIAAAWGVRALTLAKAAQDHDAMASCHRQIAEVELAKGDGKEAGLALDRAMASFERAGNFGGVVQVLIQIAQVAEARGAMDRARRTLHDALMMAQRAQAPQASAAAAGALGRLLALQGDVEGAVAHHDRAIAAWVEAGDADATIVALLAKAQVEAQNLQYDAPLPTLQRAWSVVGASPQLRAEAGVHFGWMLLACEDKAQAVAVLEEVVELLTRVGSGAAAAAMRSRVRAIASWPVGGIPLAFVLREHGDDRAAVHVLQRGVLQAQAASDPVAAAAAYAARFMCAATRGDMQEAVSALADARSAARGMVGVVRQINRLDGKVREAIFGAQLSG